MKRHRLFIPRSGAARAESEPLTSAAQRQPPAGHEPTQSAAQKQEQPSGQKPAQPAGQTQAPPAAQKPARQSGQKPAHPTGQKLAQEPEQRRAQTFDAGSSTVTSASAAIWTRATRRAFGAAPRPVETATCAVPRPGATSTSDGKLRLRAATYNIHKGVMNDMRRMRSAPTLTEIRQRLGGLHADVIFLQEVQGMNKRLATRFEQLWPAIPQSQYLAQAAGRRGPYEFAYGENAKYLHGHHGNALLSQFPILKSENRDFSDNVLEKRGVLHCVLRAPGFNLHCFVVHFGLFSAGRMRQAEALIEWIADVVDAGDPLVIAGDFNDWRDQLSRRLNAALGVRDVLNSARTFPASVPCLRLDRMYVRGLEVERAIVMRGREWARLSDHAPVVADLCER